MSDFSEPCSDETWPLRGTQIHHAKQALTGKAQEIKQGKGESRCGGSRGFYFRLGIRKSETVSSSVVSDSL